MLAPPPPETVSNMQDITQQAHVDLAAMPYGCVGPLRCSVLQQLPEAAHARRITPRQLVQKLHRQGVRLLMS